MNQSQPDNESAPASFSFAFNPCESSASAETTQAGSAASKFRARWEHSYARRKQQEEEQRQLLEEERKREHEEKRLKELQRSLEETQWKLLDATRELLAMEARKEELKLELAEAQRKQHEYEVSAAETLRLLQEEEERVELVRTMRKEEEELVELARRELEETELKQKTAEQRAQEAVERANEAENRRAGEESRTAMAMQQAEEAMNLLKTTQQALEAKRTRLLHEENLHNQAVHAQDLAPIQRKCDPEQVAKIFSDAVRAYLKTVTLQSVLKDNLQVFKGYCREWTSGSSSFPERMILDNIEEEADTAFIALKSFVNHAEYILQQNTCLPVEQFTNELSAHRTPSLNSVSQDLKEIVQSRMVEFASHYEKRNAELVKQQEETMEIIATMADGFELEALNIMGNDYYEPVPLTELLNQTAERINAFSWNVDVVDSCDLKAEVRRKKYSTLLDEEIKGRRRKIEERNEAERSRTELKIKAVVEELVRKYEVEFNKKSRPVPKRKNSELLKRIHEVVKKEMLSEAAIVFLRRYSACPELSASAQKEIERLVNANFCGTSNNHIPSVATPPTVTDEATRKVSPTVPPAKEVHKSSSVRENNQQPKKAEPPDLRDPSMEASFPSKMTVSITQTPKDVPTAVTPPTVTVEGTRKASQTASPLTEVKKSFSLREKHQNLKKADPSDPRDPSREASFPSKKATATHTVTPNHVPTVVTLPTATVKGTRDMNQTAVPVTEVKRTSSAREKYQQLKKAKPSDSRDPSTEASFPSKAASSICTYNSHSNGVAIRPTSSSSTASLDQRYLKARHAPAFKDLPSSAIAIHMGLQHTKVSLLKPGTTEFSLLVQVRSGLYLQNRRIQLAFSDEGKVSLGKPDFDLGEIIMDDPIDKKYSVVIHRAALKRRKEILLSWFIFLLKCKCELELKAKLTSCVIVVPQFLSAPQRGCVNSAATIAGFIEVKFIDDTAAIALEHMIRVGEKDREVIVTSALENGVIDVASFALKNRAVRCVGVSGTHFIKGGILDSLSKLFGNWLSRPDDMIGKIFNHTELGIPKSCLEHNLKLFAGDKGLLPRIVATFETGSYLTIVGELDPLRGGAYLAELIYGSPQSPLYKVWCNLEIHDHHRLAFDTFKQEILSTQVKETKRSSNHSSGVPMSVQEVADAKQLSILTERKDLHSLAMGAMKVLVAIEDAVKRKEIKDMNSAQGLSHQLHKHLAVLQQSSLTVEGIKQMHEKLIKIWHEHVQVPQSSTNMMTSAHVT